MVGSPVISTQTVRIVFFEQSIGCESCAPTRRALERIASDNPEIALEVLNLVLDKEKAAEYLVDRVPAIILAVFFHRLSTRDENFWERSTWRRVSSKAIAAVSLVLWISVVMAGRWIAYSDYLFPPPQ